MTLDFVSALVAVAYESSRGVGPGLSSKIGKRGFYKKLMQLLVVATAAALAPALGNPELVGLTAPEWVAGYFAAIEALSVLENAQRAGVTSPEFFHRFLTLFAEKANRGGSSGSASDGGAR